jgi:drug/metabolite transporter (DMT)-like permease
MTSMDIALVLLAAAVAVASAVLAKRNRQQAVLLVCGLFAVMTWRNWFIAHDRVGAILTAIVTISFLIQYLVLRQIRIRGPHGPTSR